MIKQLEFHLEVDIQGDLCQFFLSSESGLYLKEKIHFDTNIIELYDIWKNAYLEYYKNFRGGISISGSIPEPRDYRFQLVMAEAKLLDQFHLWLRAPELHEQRVKIANSTKLLRQSNKDWVEVFLTCKPKTLARLPWETWEIGTDIEAAAKIRITRNAKKLSHQPTKSIHHRARVLAIIGDNNGIELSEDLQIIKSSFSKSITVEVCQYQPDYEEQYFPNEICKSLENPKGWDIILFSGHSDEADRLGGRLGIGPNIFIGLQEIIGSLKISKKNGLKFAFFNSCNGLDLANILLEIGINQVAIMREPIHDEAAQTFLKIFLSNFAKFQNVHESLQIACKEFSSQEYKIRYPSISLIPSLFRHPKSDIYQLSPNNIYKLKPTKKEITLLFLLLIIKVFSNVSVPLLNTDLENIFLESRLLIQKNFKKIIGLEERSTDDIGIIEIDMVSLRSAGKEYGISIHDKDTNSEEIEFSFDNFKYLIQLLKEASKHKPKVIGIDYFFDGTKNDSFYELLNEVDKIEKETKTKILFLDTNKKDINHISRNNDKVRKGNGNFFKWYLNYPKNDKIDNQSSFSYRLAIESDNRIKIDRSIIRKKNDFNKIFYFWKWKPIIDFTIDRDKVFRQQPSCKMLNNCKLSPLSTPEERLRYPQEDKSISTKEDKSLSTTDIFIIGRNFHKTPYIDTNTYKGIDDTYKGIILYNIFKMENSPMSENDLNGSQVHAYMTHHFLKNHFLVSIPYYLIVLMLAALGKIISVYFYNNKKKFYIINGFGVLFYIIFSLLFASILNVIIPIMLPITAYLYFIYSKQKKYK